MAGQAPAKSLKDALVLLRHMMSGPPLTVTEAMHLVRDSSQRAAVRRRLRCMVDVLEHAERDGGTPERFWWSWPAEQDSTPVAVWSLAASRTMLHGFRDSVIGDTLRDLLSDHLSRLPAGLRLGSGADPGRMFYANTRLVQPLGIEPDVVDKIAKAIFECRQVSVSYEKFEGDRIWAIVEPWSVLFSDSGVYLYGRCEICERADYIDRPRLFNLARVERPRILDQRFAYPLPEEYDPRRLFENSFGIFLPPSPEHTAERIVLRFAPSWNRYLQRHKLHPAQEEPTVLDDGCIEVVLRLHVTYDLVRWVRGHGKEVEVVGPELLAAWAASGEGSDFYKAYAEEEV